MGTADTYGVGDLEGVDHHDDAVGLVGIVAYNQRVALAILLHLPYEVVAGAQEGVVVGVLRIGVAEVYGKSREACDLARGEVVVVGDTAVLTGEERLPDESCLHLQPRVGGEIVGGGVEVVVLGLRVREVARGIDEPVVEGDIPARDDVLCVCYIDDRVGCYGVS